MKTYGKALTLALAAALILASCGESQPEMGEGSTAADTTAPDTTPAETDYYANVPDGADFGGYEFTVLTYNNSGNWDIYIAPEAENGDIVNDAAFRRNSEVEDLLNITIEQVAVDGTNVHETNFKNSILAGEDEYDLCTFWSPGERSAYITENLVYNWKDMPNIDLSAPWYNQTANDAYSIAGKQYFAVSDFTFPVHQHWRVLFNKQMMEEFKREMPYQAVMDGKWTYDMMLDYCKDVYQDVNADGLRGLEDQYGMATNAWFLSAIPVNSGELPIRSTDKGFEINLYSERITNIVEDIVALTKNVDFCVELVSGNKQYEVFKQGRALFEMYGSDPALLRDIDAFDFGYLPYPKYDENQKDYIVWSAGGLLAIPNTASDISRTGAIVEALSAASTKYIKDAFVEKYIEGKVLRDEESVEIYRMMRDLATYDISYNFDTSGLVKEYVYYRQFIQSESDGAASYWASVKDAITKGYEDLWKAASDN